MKIGIDISQIVYEGTGVARYVREMIITLLTIDKNNDYVLFGASLRRRGEFQRFVLRLPRHVKLVTMPFPPMFLDFLWNRLHIVPIEWLIGPVDIFWSSDWTQPPLQRAKGITTIHDLTIFRYPESFDKTIVSVQKRRIKRALHICSMLFCDSKATRDDVMRLFHVPARRLTVVYPGVHI